MLLPGIGSPILWTPAAPPGGGGGPTTDFLSWKKQNDIATTMNATMDIGANPAGTRIWAMILWWKSTGSISRTLNSVSIGGAAATRHFRRVNLSSFDNEELWYADVTGSGLVTVTLTFDGSMNHVILALYGLNGYEATPGFSHVFDTTTPDITTDVVMSAGSVVMQYTRSFTATQFTDLVGTNEDVQDQLLGYTPSNCKTVNIGHYRSAAGETRAIGRRQQSGTTGFQHTLWRWNPA